MELIKFCSSLPRRNISAILNHDRSLIGPFFFGGFLSFQNTSSNAILKKKEEEEKDTLFYDV